MKSASRKLIFILTVLACGAFTSINFFQFILNDLNNAPFNFSDFKNNKATVVILLLSDCPASQSYTLTLNNLSEKYAKDNVRFIGVFPGKFSTDEELKQFQSEYKVTFPLLKDPAMSLVKYLHASVAPECFVVDNDSKIVYHGRIDDWLYTIGKKRMQITENNLDDAIKSVISNTPIKIKETKPIGCILEYE